MSTFLFPHAPPPFFLKTIIIGIILFISFHSTIERPICSSVVCIIMSRICISVPLVLAVHCLFFHPLNHLLVLLFLPHADCHMALPASSSCHPSCVLPVASQSLIIIIIYRLTARVVWSPQMISQPVSSIFPRSPLPSGTCRTPGLSIP